MYIKKIILSANIDWWPAEPEFSSTGLEKRVLKCMRKFLGNHVYQTKDAAQYDAKLLLEILLEILGFLDADELVTVELEFE